MKPEGEKKQAKQNRVNEEAWGKMPGNRKNRVGWIACARERVRVKASSLA